MKYLFPALVAASLILTGCGDSKPSLSDAKDEIERVFYGAVTNCSQIKLDDFEKLNGLQTGEREYTVQVRYVMKVIPPSQNEQLAAEYIARRDSGDVVRGDVDAVTAQMRRNFEKGCWAPLERILISNDILHNEREFPNGAMDYYALGFIQTFQQDVRMILTENGWKMAR